MSQSNGFSLFELNLVVATIAIVALLVVPASAPAQDSQTQVAAVEMENALRFARDKAAQEQTFYGVQLLESGRQVRVFRVHPITRAQVLDVRQPLTRGLYQIEFGDNTQAEFLWAGAGGAAAPPPVWRDGRSACPDTSAVMFDPTGVTRCYDPYGVRIQNVVARVGSSGSQVVLEIDPYSGRVRQQ